MYLRCASTLKLIILEKFIYDDENTELGIG